MNRIFSGLVLFVAVTLVGCAAAHRGTTVLKWDSGQSEPIEVKALESGMYALYAASDVKPKAVVMVKEGQPIGMEKTADGKVKFIAGDNKLPTYPDGTYYWNFRGRKDD